MSKEGQCGSGEDCQCQHQTPSKGYCQSCGMPFAKDDRVGKQGLDKRYCSLCFVDGDFVAKGMTATEFRDMVQKILREKGWSRIMAWLGTRMIPRLNRWKQSDPDAH